MLLLQRPISLQSNVLGWWALDKACAKLLLSCNLRLSNVLVEERRLRRATVVIDRLVLDHRRSLLMYLL